MSEVIDFEYVTHPVLGHDITFVLNRANQALKSSVWGGAERQYVEILWQNHRIWGVTAAIIANLSRRIAWHDQ